MGDMDAMRPAGPPRPPFPGAMPPPRPISGGGPPPQRPGGPPMPPNMMGGNPAGRQVPPPLRPMDSKGNILMGPGPGAPGGPRPGGPLSQQNPQIRPTGGSGGPLSPPGQGQARPYPWSTGPPGQPPANRPPFPGNPAARPPFARPPGPGGPPPGQQQPPFRPQFQQQPPAQQPQLPQQHQQQQQLQPPQRPPSSVGANNNEDDDDVVMGQAVTPLKSLNLKGDPMGPALLEETETSLKNNLAPFNSDRTKPSDLISPLSEMNANVTKMSNYQENLASDRNNDQRLKKPGVYKGDNDSGVDESTQEKERNGPGSPSSPAKTPTSTSSKPDKTGVSRPPSATSNKSTKSRSTSRSRLLLKTPEPEPAKKVPMNKVQVGHAPSPNLKAVRSKIGSLDNATYKPGGGHVKIESKKIEIKAAAPRIEAKNDKYTPRGGEKKIVSTKLQWNAKSKIGSLENANHKPGGGDKKIETIRAEFKDKAKPKVGSKDNVKHVAGGGDIKENTAKDIQTQKLDIKAQSKVGSMDNVKHKPGGGDKKIFDDKDYLKTVDHSVALTPTSQYWKAPKIQRATTISSSMSLPAECLVLSVSMPSLNSEQRRPKSAGPKRKPGQAVHPKPFRLY